MIPRYPEFKLLELGDREELAAYLAQAPEPICDLSFATLYLWHDCEVPSLTLLNGSLCILLESHSEPPYFLEPLGGERLSDTALACLEHAGRLSRVGERLAGLLSGQFTAEPQRDSFDYVYRVEDLAELKGKKYDGKRNQIKKFTRSEPGFEFRELTQEDLGEALELFEHWSRERDHVPVEEGTRSMSRACQLHALHRALGAYRELGLLGGGLFAGGRLHGFMIGSEINPETAVAHLQYADPKLPGVFQTLLWQACRTIFRRYAWINLEEDLGIPGLRKTKLSYQPARLISKYEILLRE